MSYCVSIIDGNLTENPKQVDIGGKSAVEITIATNISIKGERVANFFRVVFFDEREQKYLLEKAKKGSRITVTADVRTTKKETVTYTNYWGTRVIQLFTATPASDETDKGAPEEPTQTVAKPKTTPPPAKAKAPTPPPNLQSIDINDDDLPF